MMVPLLILIISFLLDGLLTNYLPFMMNQLSYLTPLLTLSSIFFLFPFFKGKKKKYFIILVIFGLLYDLAYTNLLLWNALLFLAVGYFSMKVNQYLPDHFLLNFVYLIGIIVFYESMNVLLFFLFHLNVVTWHDYFYKISHSLILNLSYGQFIYLLSYLLLKVKKRQVY